MSSFYPSEFKDWLALLAVLSPLLIAAVAALWKVWTHYKEWKSIQWKRLHELAVILYNKGHSHGEWAQIIALREMESLGIPRSTVVAVVRAALAHWKDCASESLVSNVNRALLRNDGSPVMRFWYRSQNP